MSYRGQREIFSSDSDIDSDSENLSGNESQNLNNTNFAAVIKPSQLNNSSVNNFAIMQQQNLDEGAGGAAPAFRNASISDIKEYLEIIPIFKGEKELLALFIKESEKIITYFYDASAPNNPRNDFITSRIRSKIQGEAALFLANKTINNWDDLRASLICAYSDKRDDATLAVEIVKLDQGNDSAFEFYKKIQKLLNAQITYANLNYGVNNGLNSHFERVALKTLLNGLKDPLGALMRTKDPQNLDVALNLLTNTYQKETNSQKTAKPQFSKPINNFMPFSQSFAVNNQRPIVQRNVPFNNNFYRQQAIKRPANFGQAPNSQPFNNQQNNRNNVTPMSTSTNNTYRPPNKVRPTNYHAQEVYDVENEQFENLAIFDDEIINENSENDYTPYNNFLETGASENTTDQNE